MDRKKKDHVISLVVVLIVIVALFVTARVENGISQDGAAVQISGIYGVTIQKEEIESVVLTDTLPRIERRINGASIMGIHKGIYRLEGIERARLYIHQAGGPYLRIDTSNLVIILNYWDGEKTLAAFADISALED
jgi:hypothetical protein